MITDNLLVIINYKKFDLCLTPNYQKYNQSKIKINLICKVVVFKMSFLNKDVVKDIDSNQIRLKINALRIKKLVQFVVFPSNTITKKDKRNLQKLVHMISIDASYTETQVNEKYAFKFLIELTDLIADGFNDMEIITSHFLEKQDIPNGYPGEILNDCFSWVSDAMGNPMLFTEADIDGINQYVSERLQYGFIYQTLPNLATLGDELNTDSLNIHSLVREITPMITKLRKDIRSADNSSKYEKHDIVLGRRTSMDAGTSQDNIHSIVDALRDKNNKLRCGYKSLNEMLNGGFERDRVYVFLGVPKHFKSGTLLNLMMSVSRSNENLHAKDPTKIPLIVYLTQENSVAETYQRMYTYIKGEDLAQSEAPWDEIMQTVDDYLMNNMSIKVMYRPTGSVDTSIVEQIIDDEAADGYEVVTVVQDYIKRINSETRPNDDLRLQLGSIIDEFEAIAKDKHIPIITAAQLNREAYRLTEDYIKQGKNDVGREFGTSYVAESAQIIENSDYAIMINREKLFARPDWLAASPTLNDKNRSYLSFKLATGRTNSGEDSTTYFAQPFENAMKLVEDVDAEDTASISSIAQEQMKVLSGEEKQQLSSKFGMKFTQESAAGVERLDAFSPVQPAQFNQNPATSQFNTTAGSASPTAQTQSFGAIEGTNQNPMNPGNDIDGLFKQPKQ